MSFAAVVVMAVMVLSCYVQLTQISSQVVALKKQLDVLEVDNADVRDHLTLATRWLYQQIEAGRDVHLTDGTYGIRGGEAAAHEADGQSEGADERDEFLLHKCTPGEIYFLPVFSSGGAARMSAIALRMLCSSSSGFSSGCSVTER